MTESSRTKGSQGRAYRGVSIEARRAERRQKLIAAGIQVIGSQGYHGATVKAVCGEAGLTERYFYESFSNSEALLCALYEHITGQLQTRVAEAISACQGESPEAMTDAALTAYFEFLHTHPHAARLIMTEILGISADVDARYRRVMNDFAKLLLSVLAGLHPGRQPAPVQDMLIATGIIGALVNMAMRWMLDGFRESVEDVVAAARFVLLAVNNQLGGSDRAERLTSDV